MEAKASSATALESVPQGDRLKSGDPCMEIVLSGVWKVGNLEIAESDIHSLKQRESTPTAGI
jgi:hypothetical protein